MLVTRTRASARSISTRAYNTVAYALLILLLAFPNLLRAEQGLQSKHAKFTWDGSGRTGRPGALEVSFTRYKSQDDLVVERIAETYKSNSEALARLQSLMKRASRIVERSKKQLPGGTAPLDRVVATFDGTKTAKPKAIVAWADGRTLNLIQSQSLPLALDFEEQTQTLGPPGTPGLPLAPPKP